VSRILFAIILTVLLGGCQQSATKVLLGGTLRPSADSAPVEDSIIVITGSTIRAAGLRKDVPVPQDSERTDMRGKWIVGAGTEPVAANQPANLRIYDQAPGPDSKPVRSMTMGVWDR
jgi:hypothetical protein